MEWVTVHRTNGVLDAEILKNMLESYGIPVRLRYEAYGKIAGLTTDGLGVAEILVPAVRAEEARKVLEPLPPQDQA